jgi:hypothetical protein
VSNYTYQVVVGKTVVAVRQTTSVAMIGAAPTIAVVGAAYPAKYANGLYTYCDPANHSTVTLNAGGLFDFSDNACLSLRCVRAFCGGGQTYSVFVQDRGGANVATILAGEGANATSHEFDGTGIIVLPGQNVKITTTAAGIIDAYFTRYEFP